MASGNPLHDDERERDDLVLLAAVTAESSDLRAPLLLAEAEAKTAEFAEGGDGDDPKRDAADRDRDRDTVQRDIVLPRCCTTSSCRRNHDDGEPLRKINHNVALTLLLSFLYGISDGIWGGTVFAAYLKRLGHGQNSPVGDVEAVNGLAGLVSALPMGYLADKIGRARVIRGGGVLLAVTAILHAYLSQWIGVDDDADGGSSDDRRRADAFWLLAGVMAMWGVAGGVVWGPTQALYADSTPRGSRSKSYTYLFAAGTLASAVGPLVSIILFQTIGDEWNLYQLREVMYVGFGLEIVNAILMMFFDDRKALDEPEEDGAGGGGEGDDSAVATGVGSAAQDGDKVGDEEAGATSNTMSGVKDDEAEGGAEAGVNPIAHGRADEERPLTESAGPPDPSGDDAITLLERRRRFIPYIIFLQTTIFAIGSGMTIKFFPLFFKDEVGMSPTQVQIIYVIVPIAMVSCSHLGTSLASTGFGRVQSVLAIRTVGVALLYSMVFCKRYLDAHPFVLVPIYVARTALMNCTYPLQESILMDFVPRKERGRWKSLDSISAFGWCGSAAVGGWLTDRYDYTYTFFVTAALQSVGLLVFATLLPLVPRREEDFASASGGRGIGGGGGGGGGAVDCPPNDEVESSAAAKATTTAVIDEGRFVGGRDGVDTSTSSSSSSSSSSSHASLVEQS